MYYEERKKIKKIRISDESFKDLLDLYESNDSMAMAYLGWDKDTGATVEFSLKQIKIFIDRILELTADAMLNNRVVTYQISGINHTIQFLSMIIRSSLNGNAIKGALHYLIRKLFELDKSIFDIIEWNSLEVYYATDKKSDIYRKELHAITPKLYETLEKYRQQLDTPDSIDIPTKLLMNLRIDESITPVKREFRYHAILNVLEGNFSKFFKSIDTDKYRVGETNDYKL